MSKLVIRQHQSLLRVLTTLVGSAVCAFLFAPFGESTLKLVGFVLVVMAPGILYSWVYFIASQRVIRIDQSANEVVVDCLSFTGFRQKAVYPLSSFNRVMSFVTMRGGDSGVYGANWVALVFKSEKSYLLLTHFPPGTSSPDFWSGPVEIESEHARALRVQLSTEFGLVDLGFLGTYSPPSYKSRMV